MAANNFFLTQRIRVSCISHNLRACCSSVCYEVVARLKQADAIPHLPPHLQHPPSSSTSIQQYQLTEMGQHSWQLCETLWCKACKSILSLAYKPNLHANGKISVKHLDQTIVQPRMTKCCFRFTGSRILASLNWVPSHLCSAVKPCQTARSLIHFNCSSWNCGTARVSLDALTLGRSRAQSSIGYGLFVVHAWV